ncbi:MAG TPA: site-2 protease family protein [Solirubrobacteraceae bacterium]|nr:site-2 protease family protein [Solirubrobacteraceae bacterium]
MFGRGGQIKLFDVSGIRVGVDLGWFLSLFVVIIWLSPSFRIALGGSDGPAYATTVISALLFFGSLVVHELGHALAARRQGIAVRSIQLFLFGGLTQMSRDTRTPGEELKVAAAGPLATLGVVVLFGVIDLALVGPHRLWHAFLLDGHVRVTPVLLALSWLLLMNAVVFVFNLVPAFPLDGGRILRALVWRVAGDKRRGTIVAAQVGRVFAYLLGGLGLYLMLFGSGTFGGLWLVLLAFLLGQSARGALVQSAVSERIEGVRVADIMDRQPVTMAAATPAAQALDEYFRHYGWAWFPLVDETGHFLGIARQERAQAALDAGEGWVTMASVAEAHGCRIEEESPISDVLSSESLGLLGALMAVDRDGVLRGVVTVEQVRRALQSAFSSAPAG